MRWTSRLCVIRVSMGADILGGGGRWMGRRRRTGALDVEVVDVDFCVGVRSLSSAQSGCNVALPECVEEDILAEGTVVVEWL